MKPYVVASLIVACAVIVLLAPRVSRAGKGVPQRVRFAPVHIYLDSGNTPLAAHQFELKATAGRIKIVGVEGGEHPAFNDAPYYDPAALTNDRIIIAAFSTSDDLPEGRTRIATLHLQILGDAEPEYELRLVTAGDTAGREVPATLSLQEGDEQ